MAFITFTMGKNDAYFFNSPTHWARRNLPPDVETLFTKQPPIRDVLELALGDNGAYFVSYRDADGVVYCRHYNLPNPLTTYLYHSHPHIIRDLPTLSLTLGPYESYYAYDKTSASWSNLPPVLDKALSSRLVSQDPWKTVWRENGREAPSFVSLGADGSYFMRTVAGGGSWDLSRSKSEGLAGINKFLEDSPNFLGIAGVYLFPNHPHSYILLQTTGKAFSNLPEHTWTDYQKMLPSLPKAFQPPTPQQSPFQQGQQAAMPPPQSPQPVLGIISTGIQPSPRSSISGTPVMTPRTPQTPAPAYSQFASPALRQGSFSSMPQGQQYQAQPMQNQYFPPQQQQMQYPNQQQFVQPQQQQQQNSGGGRAPNAAVAGGGIAAIGAIALGALVKGRHGAPGHGHGHHSGHGGGQTADPTQQQQQGFDPSQFQQQQQGQQTFDPSQFQQQQQQGQQQTFDPSQFQQQQNQQVFDPSQFQQQPQQQVFDPSQLQNQQVFDPSQFQQQSTGVIYDSSTLVPDTASPFNTGDVDPTSFDMGFDPSMYDSSAGLF